MLFQIFLTLYSAILQLANLFTLENWPFLILILIEEVKNEYWMSEVDEGIPYIAMINVVYWQVEKVELP